MEEVRGKGREGKRKLRADVGLGEGGRGRSFASMRRGKTGRKEIRGYG